MTVESGAGAPSSSGIGAGEATPIAEARLLGVRLTLQDADTLLERMAGWIRAGSRKLVLSGNIHAFNLAYELDWLRQLFEQAGAVRMDGAGLRLAAWLLGCHPPPRSTAADFIWTLADFAAGRGIRLFLLGSRPGVAAEAAARLRQRSPGLIIAGARHGYFDTSAGGLENAQVVDEINRAGPDLLIVGMGMPLQERWLRNNWGALAVPVAMTGGAVFDYTAGRLRRPPRWMQQAGLEWLGRLIIEPRKLWRRYLIGNPVFLWRFFRLHGLPFRGGLARRV
jgi:N-acetylglucosaminyldiphosphoundecaprenol N-acetyl-beta-D-mannosaminyltransferase